MKQSFTTGLREPEYFRNALMTEKRWFTVDAPQPRLSESHSRKAPTESCVTKTIRICKDRNVLKEYLENKEQEVVDIMMTLFDDEQIWEAYSKNIKDSATREPEKETARETAERMIRKSKLSLEEIETEIMQLA